MSLVIPRLYAIMDPAQAGSRGIDDVLDSLLGAGVKLIQYRDKKSPPWELFRVSTRLVEYAHAANCSVIVNDRADIAMLAGADGVHVGQDDLPVEFARRVVGPGRLAGYSTHDIEQIRQGNTSSADYVAFGPVFQTRTKERPDPVVGLEGLRRAREATHKPLVAIGGITIETARSVIEAGADSVAVISGLIGASDIAERARDFLVELGKC